MNDMYTDSSYGAGLANKNGKKPGHERSVCEFCVATILSFFKTYAHKKWSEKGDRAPLTLRDLSVGAGAATAQVSRGSIHSPCGRGDQKGSPREVVTETDIRTNAFHCARREEVFRFGQSENIGRRL